MTCWITCFVNISGFLVVIYFCFVFWFKGFFLVLEIILGLKHKDTIWHPRNARVLAVLIQYLILFNFVTDILTPCPHSFFYNSLLIIWAKGISEQINQRRKCTRTPSSERFFNFNFFPCVPWIINFCDLPLAYSDATQQSKTELSLCLRCSRISVWY